MKNGTENHNSNSLFPGKIEVATQNPKKFLFVSFEGLIGDLAWQVKREGHQAKYFIRDKGQKDCADGFVEKAEDWEKEKDWADVIVFDDVGFGGVAEALRKGGKLVVGGSVYTDKLEIDREFGQNEMKAVGINALPHWDFTDFDQAILFVKEHPGRYVIKPSGSAQNEKELLFIGQEEDGKDVLSVLEHYKKNWARKIKIFQIQKFASGVEVAVGTFFNGKDFITPINVNFEHKRLFPGDIGPSTGEMGTSMYWSPPNTIFNATLGKMKEKLAASGYVGYIDINCIANNNGIYPLEFTCFDEKTEILTKDGWKNYLEVKTGDCALAIHPATRELAWKKIVHTFVRDYKGRMIKIGAKNKSHSAADVLVTPEHKLLISNSGHLKFVQAGSLPRHNAKMIRTGLFHCIKKDHIEIPAYAEKHFLGKRKKTIDIVHPARMIETHAFMKFLGLFLAQGFFGGRNYIIGISQSPKGMRRREMEKILNNIGFKYTIQKNGNYHISSVQLCKFIGSLGLAHAKAGEKFVPDTFKEFAPEYLASLIYGFALGDGNWHKRANQLSLATASKKLADDLQEIIIKCGKIANIHVQRQKGAKSIGGYTRKHDTSLLSIRGVKTDYSLDKRVMGEEYYEGKIWDVEVEDWHTLLVRRNGKPFFSGNCRFGYPTISIQMEGVVSPWGEFLHALARGEGFELKTKRGFQVGVVIAVSPFPFNDPHAFARYSEGASVIFKKEKLDGVHLGDIKIVEGDWVLAGDSGYALVITASGPTMEGARKKAYFRVENIMLPNMFYRTDIGSRWGMDSDKLHTWGYLY